MQDPQAFVITRRRKKYKFAWFGCLSNCYEAVDWQPPPADQQLIVELGAGTGLFALALARAHPETLVVAVDVKADRLQTGARLAVEQGTENVLFLRARADLLAGYFRPGSLSGLWLTFPDPFPKKRQAKHRLTHPVFLAIYRSLLAPGARLHLKTDNHALFDWSLEQLVGGGAELDWLSYDLHDGDAAADFRHLTTFEMRYVAEGRSVCALSASLPRSQASPSPALSSTTR